MRFVHRAVRVCSMLGLLVATASCSGGADAPLGGGGTGPGAGSITLALGSSSGSVVAGASTTVNVTIGRVGSFTGAVTLTADGAPTGVVVTAPAIAAGASSAVVNIAVSSGAQPGSSPITIRAAGTGVTTVTAVYTLTVTAAPVQNYTLSVPATLSVEQGKSGTATVTIARSGGFTGAVSLSTSAAPQDVQISVAPNPATQNTSTITITTQSAAAVGSYPITVSGTDNATLQRTTQFTLVVTAKPTASTLTLAPAAVQVVQGATTDIAVTFTRGTGVTGNATFVLDGAPTNITGTFTPNNTAGSTATLKLNVGLLQPVGTVSFRVLGIVGTDTASANLALTTTLFVAPDFSLVATPATFAVTAGNNTSSTIGITRTGGFTGAVNLSVTGAPAGVTASFTPSSVSGATAALNVTTTGAAAAGVYALTVTGTATGVTGTRTTSVSLTVNAPTGMGNIQWRFCAPARAPLWFATRAGSSGAWTQLTPDASTTYSVPFTQNGQVAYVHQTNNGFQVTVLGFTPAEAAANAATECSANPLTKTVNGTVTGLGASFATVVMGGSAFSTVAPPLGSYTATGVADRVTDVVAFRVALGAGGFTGYDRAAIRRNINPANNATIGPLDISGAESALTVGANMVFDGYGADAFALITSLTTNNGLVGAYRVDLPSTDASRDVRTLPPSLTQAGDLYQFIATTTDLTAPRQLLIYSSATISPGTKSFGPLLNATTVSVLGNAPVRLRAQGSWQNEYGLSAGASFQQGQVAPNERSVTITGTRAFLGDAGYAFEVPDFTGAPGWNPTWMLRSGVSTQHIVSLLGQSAGGNPTPANGVVLRSAQRVGTTTP